MIAGNATGNRSDTTFTPPGSRDLVPENLPWPAGAEGQVERRAIEEIQELREALRRLQASHEATRAGALEQARSLQERIALLEAEQAARQGPPAAPPFPEPTEDPGPGLLEALARARSEADAARAEAEMLLEQFAAVEMARIHEDRVHELKMAHAVQDLQALKEEVRRLKQAAPPTPSARRKRTPYAGARKLRRLRPAAQLAFLGALGFLVLLFGAPRTSWIRAGDAEAAVDSIGVRMERLVAERALVGTRVYACETGPCLDVPVPFAPGREALPPTPALEAVGGLLQLALKEVPPERRQGLTLIVEGHTDSREASDLRDRYLLSARRALVVLQELQRSGLEAAAYRPRIVGLGDTAPVCWGEADQCPEKNRRITLRLHVDRQEHLDLLLETLGSIRDRL